MGVGTSKRGMFVFLKEKKAPRQRSLLVGTCILGTNVQDSSLPISVESVFVPVIDDVTSEAPPFVFLEP